MKPKKNKNKTNKKSSNEERRGKVVETNKKKVRKTKNLFIDIKYDCCCCDLILLTSGYKF